MEISKQDWKLFLEKLPVWQDRYKATLNASYIELLNGPGSATEKFWELLKRIRLDKRHPGVVVNGLRPSDVPYLLRLFRCENVITDEDLADFSEELQRVVAAQCGEET